MTEHDLGRLEQLVFCRRREEAITLLLDLLNGLDFSQGQFELSYGNGTGVPDERTLVRFATAMTALFADPSFELSDTGFIRLIGVGKWISAVFHATPFANTDHILQAMMTDSGSIAGKDLVKFAALYSQESLMNLPIDDFYAIRPKLALALGLSLVCSRQVISATSHQKREDILGWLPAKLDSVENLDDIPLAALYAMMHCSYADTEKKHDIKKSLNCLIRRDMLQRGIRDFREPPSRDQPVMLVILDWWSRAHAMYRCYAPFINACKKRFRLVAVSTMPVGVQEDALEMFDDVIEFSRDVRVWTDELRRVLPLIGEVAPDVVYFPAVGMALPGFFLSNLRLAPLQIATLGHPATPAAQCIDYVLSPPETLGSVNVFHEPVRMLPRGSISFLPSPDAPPPIRSSRTDTKLLRIAITASIMKLNPRFLEACKVIAESSGMAVEFAFFLGAGVGLSYLNARKSILTVLPSAVTYGFSAYPEYAKKLSECDMFLSPFPFGNTNGIVDCVRLGIPGICLHGDQPHSSIDRGLFKLVGMPDYLVATTVEDYIAAAIALANNKARRRAISRKLLSIDMDAHLAAGRPEGFVETVLDLMAGTAVAAR